MVSMTMASCAVANPLLFRPPLPSYPRKDFTRGEVAH